MLKQHDSHKFKVFETVPDLYLILSPSFYILNASNAYLEATGTVRENIVGRYIFDVFPDNPKLPDATGVTNVQSSLQQAMINKKPHYMPLQRYDVPVSMNPSEGFQTKYWSPVHTPVMDENNEIEYIIQKVLDVTKEVEKDEDLKSLKTKSELLTELVASKKRAEAEKQKIYSLFMQAPAIIAILQGPEHIFELANPKYMQLVGKNRHILGKPVREALPELQGQGFFEILDNVFTNKKPLAANEMPAFLDKNENGDLDKVYLNIIYQPTFETDGSVNGILIHATDITEQVILRRKTEESEEKYRSLFEKMGQGFCIIEMIFDDNNTPADYRFIESNPQFENQTGLKDANGKTTRELIPDLEAHWFERYGKVALTGEPVQFIEGSEVMGRWFEVNAYRMGSDGSSKVALLFSDISYRKKSEEALKESEERFRIMADAAPNIVWGLNPDGSVRYINKFGLEYLGISLEEFLKVSWDPYVHPEDLLLTITAVEDAIKNRDIYSQVLRLLRKDGTYRWILSQGAPSYYSNGRLYGYVGTGIDITDLKQANALLIKTNNDLDNFIYTASHDLKAPMSNIEGLLNSLRESFKSENSQMNDDTDILLQLMQQSINRFKSTILDLTEITKVQKTEEEDINEITLSQLLEEVKLSILDQIHISKAIIHSDFSQAETLKFSKKNLKSIFYNLVSNALKYKDHKKAPEIFIKSQKTKNHLVISIQDNGLGINKENQTKIFGMFKRVHDHVEGTGIGLYIVKRIIDNAEGRIEVESEEGKGTTFKVYFKQ